MEKKIILNNQEIKINLKKVRRAKNISLTVRPDLSVMATMPKWVSYSAAEKFIYQKADWLLDKINYFIKNPLLKPRKNKEDFLNTKNKALALIELRLEYFNKVYNFKYNRITARDQKTRWGSCSRKGNLNFNYKVIYLGESARDYIIIHELCHLKEFNHGRKFWDLVAKACPRHKEIRRELRSDYNVPIYWTTVFGGYGRMKAYEKAIAKTESVYRFSRPPGRKDYQAVQSLSGTS